MIEEHSGGCACGSLRYRVRGMPTTGSVCHCTFCQRRLASAFAVLASFPEEAVEIVQGELATVEHRSDDSGRWMRMDFCPRCGTTVAHRAEVRPGIRTIAAGTFDQPGWFPIHRHIWVRSKLAWVVVPPDVEAYERGYVAPTASGT